MITIELPSPPSLNNLFINVPKRGRVLSPEYRAWRTEAGFRLNRQKPLPFFGPVLLKFEHEDKGGKDGDNLLKAPIDLLVEHRIIAGDHRSIVRGFSFAWSADIVGMRVTVIPVASVTSPV